jgi:hypothetical protein
MRLISRARGTLLGTLAAFVFAVPAVAADRAYTEGSVVNVASVRTEPGMFDAYMRYLAGPYKQLMEAQKAAGIILDYSVYAVTPRGEHDPDLYLITVYKNMAALDGLNDRTDAIQEKIYGTPAEQDAKTIERGKLRTLVGSDLMRELILK